MNANADNISSLCKQLIAPLKDKIEGLVNSLASKDDLQKFIHDIESKFELDIKYSLEHFTNELELRDNKINSLDLQVESLKLSSVRNATEYDNLIERIENVENSQNNIYQSSSTHLNLSNRSFR